MGRRIESALGQARAAAGDRDVAIAGGAGAVSTWRDVPHRAVAPIGTASGRESRRGDSNP
jgi:hypothetical protein